MGRQPSQREVRIKLLRDQGKTYKQIMALTGESYQKIYYTINPDLRASHNRISIATKSERIEIYNQRLENDWKEIKLKDERWIKS